MSTKLPKRLFARNYKLFDVNGATILFNCQTTHITEVHPIILDTLKLCDGRDTDDIIRELKGEYSIEDLKDAIGELRSVKLVAGSRRKYFYRPRNMPQKRPKVSFLCLNVAEDCNLRCRYCYVNQGDFSGVRRLMTQEVARRAIDYLVVTSGENKRCRLNFFGGEPLLNVDLIRRSCEYASEVLGKAGKNCVFDLSTNGTIVTDEIIKLFKEFDFKIQVSLDGPSDIQDAQRPFIDGSPSHDLICENLKRLRNAGIQIATSSVVCKDNISPYDSYHYVNEKSDNGSMITIEHPRQIEGDFTVEQMKKVREEFGKLVDEYFADLIAKKRQQNILMGKCLKRIVGGKPVVDTCAAGRTMMAVGADGLIYPCSLVVGNIDAEMGSVFEPPPLEELQNPFDRFNSNNIEACYNCWARYICGGGCPADAIVLNGEMRQSPILCDFAMMLYEMIIEKFAEAKLPYSMFKEEYQY